MVSWREQLCARLSHPVSRAVRALHDEEAAVLREIRIRMGRPIEMVLDRKSRLLHTELDAAQMDELITALCGYARYAWERQMAEGYIPLPGGHRAGLCGRCVLETDGAHRMSGITSVCIRIARHIPGASLSVRPCLCTADGRAQSVLLLGTPGCGKTTVLRDAAMYLSDTCGLHVAVADEREELFAGCAAAGQRIDVLAGMDKASAMQLLLRAMAPQVIVTDEIGREADVEAICEAARCGAAVLASAHAAQIQDVLRRPMLRMLWERAVFDRCVLLGHNGVCMEAWDARNGMEEGWTCSAGRLR